MLVPPSGLPNKFKFQGSKEEDFGPGTEEEEVGWRMFPIHNSVWSLVCIFSVYLFRIIIEPATWFCWTWIEDHHDDFVFRERQRGSQLL